MPSREARSCRAKSACCRNSGGTVATSEDPARSGVFEMDSCPFGTQADKATARATDPGSRSHEHGARLICETPRKLKAAGRASGRTAGPRGADPAAEPAHPFSRRPHGNELVDLVEQAFPVVSLAAAHALHQALHLVSHACLLVLGG